MRWYVIYMNVLGTTTIPGILRTCEEIVYLSIGIKDSYKLRWEYEKSNPGPVEEQQSQRQSLLPVLGNPKEDQAV